MNHESTPVRLRPATLHDAAAVAGLVTELGYPTEAGPMRGRLERFGAHPDYRTLVAEAEGEVLGLIGLQRGWLYEYDRPFVRVMALVVSRAARRRGVGARLMAAADEFAREHDAHGVQLTTALHREEAHRFYEGLGFSRTGWRYVRPGE
jgi:GNAT superfamily N-acetyltransferase